MKTISLLLTTVLLSACGNHKTKQTPPTQWQDVNTWSFSGKMAINDGNNSGSGRIKWSQTKNTTQAQFKAPLGQGSWKIEQQLNQARLTSSSNGERKARYAEQLISKEIGWHFPWDNLNYWLRGHEINSNLNLIEQPITTLTDGEWELHFSKWIKTPMGLLPKKIKAIKPPYSVKLVIYKWNIQ